MTCSFPKSRKAWDRELQPSCESKPDFYRCWPTEAPLSCWFRMIFIDLIENNPQKLMEFCRCVPQWGQQPTQGYTSGFVSAASTMIWYEMANISTTMYRLNVWSIWENHFNHFHQQQRQPQIQPFFAIQAALVQEPLPGEGSCREGAWKMILAMTLGALWCYGELHLYMCMYIHIHIYVYIYIYTIIFIYIYTLNTCLCMYIYIYCIS